MAAVTAGAGPPATQAEEETRGVRRVRMGRRMVEGEGRIFVVRIGLVGK
jgi:hypothetical protein